ncbi:hypothetical protein QBC36DRAFT_200872, partial [Triangularia setosa]
FANRNGLTRHNRNQHYLKGTFNQPIHCPLCPDFIINSAEEWSSHTARRHGLQYASGKPGTAISARIRPTKTQATRSARCLLCEQLHYPGNAYSRHINKNHSKNFETPFSCPECERLGLKPVSIEHRDAWVEHTVLCHQQHGQTGVIVDPDDFRKSKREKRKRDVEDNEEPAAKR